MSKAEPGSLWMEVDGRGRLLGASPGMLGILEAFDPPVRGLEGAVARRLDLASAIDRGAGRLRLHLGRGAQRRTFLAEVGRGARGGARLRLTPAEGPSAEVDALLDGWARQNRSGLLVTDLDDTILMASPSFASMLGYRPEEIEGLDLHVLRGADVPAERWGALDDALATVGSFAGEVSLRRFDGTSVPVRVRATRVRVDGVPAGTVSTWEDISLDRETSSIERADQLAEAMVQVARGVAHEVNNIATELVAWSDRAREAPEEAADILQRQRALGEALGQVGLHLLRLAGTVPGQGPVDLAEAARDVAWTLERLGRRAWPVEVEATGPGPWLEGDASAIRNLAVLLAYRAAERVAGRVPIRVSARDADGEAALVIAFDADTTERMALRRLVGAERYRPVLAAQLHERARKAGVALRLEELRDEVRLVLAGPAVLVCSDEEETSPPGAIRYSRVLVVEDNDDLRELVAHAIESRFDDVVTAADGRAALEHLDQLEGRVDLVISDVLLPGASGLAVYRRALERNPEVRVLFVSGAAPTRELQANLRADRDAYLQKPFALAEMLDVVDRLVRAEADG